MSVSKERITGEQVTLATTSRNILITAPNMKKMVDDVVQRCVRIQRYLQEKDVKSLRIMEHVTIPNSFTSKERNAQQVKRILQLQLLTVIV